MSRDKNLWMICVGLFFLLVMMSMCNAAIPSTQKVCDEMGGTMTQEEGRGSICILRVTE